jgi:hypothetical protein
MLTIVLQQNEQEYLLVKVLPHVALSTTLRCTTFVFNVLQTITLTLVYSVCPTMSHHPTLSSTGEELGLKEQALIAVLLKRTLCMFTHRCLNLLMWTFGQFLGVWYTSNCCVF